MDILFLTVALMSAVLFTLLLGGGIYWLIEHLTWKFVVVASSLISTIAMLSATCYALWVAFGWWMFTYIAGACIHGLFAAWLAINHDRASLNRPIYRVGGGDATSRLHR